MSTKITVYDLLISCPSDVSQIVDILEKEIYYFNNYYGRFNNIIIRPVHWSKDSFSTIGEHPQEILNKQIVDNSDMVIGVFWTRFGTPTNEYGSGTEEEIERMISDKKQVFLYFLDKPMSPSKIDHKQYKKVQKFQKKHMNDGIFFTVESEEALVKKFHQNLQLHFNSILNKTNLKQNNIPKEILWVDDRPENNVFERKVLEHYGINFALALNTNQAFDLFNNRDFALVISDINRKEGSEEGYILLEKIRKINRHIPFIVYTGTKTSESKNEILLRGGQGCTNDPNELVDLVLENIIKG